MPEIVTIDKAQLLAHEDASKLLNQLLGDPDHSLSIQRAIKKVRPQAALPQIDIGDPIRTEFRTELDALKAQNQSLIERIAAEDQRRADEAAERDLRSKIDHASAKFHLTGEGRDMMLDRMKKEGSFDAEAAAAWVAAQEPSSAPVANTGFAPSELNLFGVAEKDDKFALLHTKPWSFFDNEVNAVLRDFQAAA